MKLHDRLLRMYLFRIAPGSEPEVQQDLSSRLTDLTEERWAFFSWFGRFDFLAAGETETLFGQDTFLFTPNPLPSVFDVAEIIAFQVDLDAFPAKPTLGELLVPPDGNKYTEVPWVSLSLLKLDHERLLDPATVAAYQRSQGKASADERVVLPYCLETHHAAMNAVRRVELRLSEDEEFRPFELAVGGGLGDSELVVVCRYARQESLFRFLEECGALCVHDLKDGLQASDGELRAPLLLSSFTQVGIDYDVVRPGFERDEHEAIRFAGADHPVMAFLQCSGPRSRTLPGVHSYFPPRHWSHAHVLGVADDLFYARRSLTAGQLVRRWVQLRREIGRRGQTSNRDRTEVTLVQPAETPEEAPDVPRPVRPQPLEVASDTVTAFMTLVESAPQELRAVEHVLERCAALCQNSGATLALADFLSYFRAVQQMMATIVERARELQKLRTDARLAAEDAQQDMTERRLGPVQSSSLLSKIDGYIERRMDDQALDLRKLTDTVSLFDGALEQRVGAETEDLLTGGFSNRAVSHIGSLSRLIMAGSYLAHAVYGHLNELLRQAGQEELPYEGFIFYCRANEAWSFSRDIAQLPDSALWYPEDADILLHEIGHQLGGKVGLDDALKEAGKDAKRALILPGDRDVEESITLIYRDLSNLWADLFWCAISCSATEAGAKEFIQDRLTWLAHRRMRYSSADLRRAIGRLYAITACCGLLDRNSDSVSLEKLRASYPPEKVGAVLDEGLAVWEGHSQHAEESDWIRRGARHFLRSPEQNQWCVERYQHALLMTGAVSHSPPMQVVLGKAGAHPRTSKALTDEVWCEFRETVCQGRVPGLERSPVRLGTIPQLMLDRLSTENGLGSLSARMAVTLWLYDLYCREVLAPSWEKNTRHTSGRDGQAGRIGGGHRYGWL